ncbi:MAG: thioesterase family protein [Burkholderiales bacterium]|nr:thioesterase family protein [Burkholderiales bacterium]
MSRSIFPAAGPAAADAGSGTLPHPFDAAVALQERGEGRFGGQPHPGWHNMVGPFGGITAATVLQAVLRHPARLGDPVSLTVNYLSAVQDAPFEVEVTPVRTNRSTQHWTATMTQAGEGGAAEPVLTATLVTALRRPTWGATDMPMPEVPAPESAGERVRFKGAAWVSRYDMRVVQGGLPTVLDDSGDGSLTRLWLRDAQARPLDFPALAALADAFYPRAWLRRARLVPAGTVSFTVYFHADAAALATVGDGWLLGQAQAQRFSNNFADQTGQLWSQAGELLVTTHQWAYYKE